MTTIENLELLVNMLEKWAAEEREEIEREDDEYMRGYKRAEASTHELCAKWIKEALGK